MALRYRRHGLVWPWSKLQVASWMCFLFQSAAMCTLVLPDLPLAELGVVSTMYFSTFVAIVVFGFASTVLDPTDPAVLLRSSPLNLPPPKAVLTEGPGPSGSKLCLKCETRVGVKSKHCGICNRCTAGFDHHCGWLNNCVGRKNYRWFIALVCAIQAAVSLQTACALQLLQRLVQDNEEGRELLARHSFQEGGYMYLSCIFLLAVLSFAIFLANGVLLYFHIYLKVKHTTTYEFILSRRLRQAQVTPAHMVDSGNINSSGGTKPDVYKVQKESLQDSLEEPSPEQSFTFRTKKILDGGSASVKVVSSVDFSEDEATWDNSGIRGRSESRLQLKRIEL